MKNNVTFPNPRSIRRLGSVISLSLFCLLAARLPLPAQSYQVFPSHFPAGGGSGNSGIYQVRGSVNAMPARHVSTITPSRPYALRGGFWAMLTVVNTPGAPMLSLTRSGQFIIISWPAPSDGFVLQSASGLETSSTWTTVKATPQLNQETISITLPLEKGARFFRLLRKE